MTSLVQRFKESIALTSQYPFELEIRGGEGCLLHTAEGDFLDFMAGVAVNNLGYQNELVTNAIVRQAYRYSHAHVFGEYVQFPQVELAETLLESFPPGRRVFFTNSGTESTELAMKMSYKLTGRPGFVAFENGLHGRSTGALSVSHKTSYRNGFKLLDGVQFLPYNERRALKSVIWENVAGVILELVQNGSGYTPADRLFVFEIMKLSEQYGFKVIFDEIQTGLGRTGKLFAQEHYGVTPDYTLLGKAFGGGLPLGAVVAKSEDFEKLQDPPISHATTFGGNPVCCAAGLASLRQISDLQFLRGVTVSGQHLNDLCTRLRDISYGLIEETRGQGLMRSLIFSEPKHVGEFVLGCYNEGLLVGLGVTTSKYVRLTPPLIVTDDQLDEAFGIMKNVILDMAGKR